IKVKSTEKQTIIWNQRKRLKSSYSFLKSKLRNESYLSSCMTTSGMSNPISSQRSSVEDDSPNQQELSTVPKTPEKTEEDPSEQAPLNGKPRNQEQQENIKLATSQQCNCKSIFYMICALLGIALLAAILYKLCQETDDKISTTPAPNFVSAMSRISPAAAGITTAATGSKISSTRSTTRPTIYFSMVLDPKRIGVCSDNKETNCRHGKRPTFILPGANGHAQNLGPFTCKVNHQCEQVQTIGNEFVFKRPGRVKISAQVSLESANTGQQVTLDLRLNRSRIEKRVFDKLHPGSKVTLPIHSERIKLSANSTIALRLTLESGLPVELLYAIADTDVSFELLLDN
ncbi:hypothetical protein BOX15_Mlig010472g1, partial [Macrostomum lignano]